VKKRTAEWDKIFMDCISEKDLISKMYEKVKQSNCKKTSNPINKKGKESERTFSKEAIKMPSVL
jgi:hypothetical protein